MFYSTPYDFGADIYLFWAIDMQNKKKEEDRESEVF